MKRIDLIRHLERHVVQLLREGGQHSVYVNRSAGKTSTVPRHREINEFWHKRSAKIWKCPGHNPSQAIQVPYLSVPNR
jgi:hypothetical protein